jgi:hypothetical protein
MPGSYIVNLQDITSSGVNKTVRFRTTGVRSNGSWFYCRTLLPMEPRVNFSSLNEQQLMMVRLLKRPLHEEDFVQLRRLATQLVNARLDAALNKWEQANPAEE